MATFFQHYFEEGDFGKTEASVKCPYPHHTVSGEEYYESNPSASVNVDKKVFHCMRCGASKSEVGFIADVLGCNYETASKVQRVFEKNTETIYDWDMLLEMPDDVRLYANQLGISDSVIDELKIKSSNLRNLSFPVTLYDKIMDSRDYNQGETPKVKSRTGAIPGLVIPFDIWRHEPKDKWTLLVAGEKDMAVARSIGFKAITLTGGEGISPIFINEFKGRKVAIMYDNDDAGIQGAKRLAAQLKPYTSQVRVVTSFHEVCVEKGEDFTDLIMKYGAKFNDVAQYIAQTPDFTEEEALEEVEKMFPTITLFQAASPQNIAKTVRSNIQVVATFESTFSIPTSMTAEKVKDSVSDKELWTKGKKTSWDLGDNNVGDILHLMDNNFKEKDIIKNQKDLLRVPDKETGIKLSRISKETVFKCSVTDLFESSAKDVRQMEYVAYSVGVKLESGKKYKATYQIVPHPYQGQQLTMIITDVSEASDSITNFAVTEDVAEQLKKVQEIPGSVKEKVDTLSEMVRGIVGFEADKQLIQAIDLTYHTVLNFNFGQRFIGVRGYLDTLVVSESRYGKSSTAEALRKMYNLGTMVSLAGSSATKAGIIGGANKVGGSYQTRAGIIPQNHRNMIIFEELAKCNSDILRELTDIRSSNEVRIVRVNGALYLPALVRMLTLTNVKSQGTMTRPIASYPNGIEIVSELIGTAEDIARYDMMVILGENKGKQMNFDWTPREPLDPSVYQARIRWVWSRTAEQVVLTNEVLQYIVEQCNLLNDEFDTHIKIFGTEAWKKVTRLAIAVAGYVVSADETYEHLIVNKEHVDFAVDYLKGIYDNEVFRLKEYVTRERQFSHLDAEGLEMLQEVFMANPTLLDQLDQTSYATRNELMAATGVSQDDFNATLNSLIRGLFITYKGNYIMPTPRFRTGMRKIERVEHKVHKLGERQEIGAVVNEDVKT